MEGGKIKEPKRFSPNTAPYQAKRARTAHIQEDFSQPTIQESSSQSTYPDLQARVDDILRNNTYPVIPAPNDAPHDANGPIIMDTLTRALRLSYSMATPFFRYGDGQRISEVIGRETPLGLQLGSVMTHGSMLFDNDGLSSRLPFGYDMLNDSNWDQRMFSSDEAACVAIGDTRARFPILFDIMRSAGAPLAQIARELLKREKEGCYYHVAEYRVDTSNQGAPYLGSFH